MGTPVSQDATATPDAPNAASKTRPGWWPALLVVGDLVAFFVFATAGRESHNEATGMGALAQTGLTALPFALGWFLVAPWLGVFRAKKVARPLDMLKWTEVAWLAALVPAFVLRSLIVRHLPPLSFVIVATVVNAVFLGGWRTAYAWLTGRGR